MAIKELHPNVKIRIAVNFFIGVAFMMIMPFLAIYFSQKLGATVTGFLYVCVILCAITGGIIGGFYGDRLGRKKIMLWGDFITVISFILIALVNSPWFDYPYVTFVIFLIAQFFEGATMPASQALLIDSSTSETRRLIFQIQYWVGNLSSALGSVVGAFLFQAHHFLLFLVVACVVFVSFFVTLFFIEDTFIPAIAKESEEKKTRGPKQKSVFLKNYTFIVKDRVFLFFVTATLFAWTIEGQLTNYVGVRMAKDIPNQPLFSGFGLHVDGTRLLGFLQSENTFLVVLGTFAIAWIVKRVNDQIALVAGVFIFTTGYTYLMFGTVPGILIFMMFVATLGELTYMPIKQAYLADIAPDDARSSYMAVYQIVQMIAMMAAGFMITIGSLATSTIMTEIIVTLGLGSAAFYYLSGRLLKRAGQNLRNEFERSQPKNETF